MSSARAWSSLAATALVAAAVSCTSPAPRSSTRPPDAGRAVAPIELRAPRGELLVTVTPSAPGEWLVAAAGAAPLTVRVTGETVVVLDAGGAPVARLEPGPTGRRLLDAAGQPVARLGAGDDLDVVSPDGVGIVHIRLDPERPGATARNAAGVPVLTARREGARILIADRDDAILATVHNLDDELAAALLASDALALPYRAALLGTVLTS